MYFNKVIPRAQRRLPRKIFFRMIHIQQRLYGAVQCRISRDITYILIDCFSVRNTSQWKYIQ